MVKIPSTLPKKYMDLGEQDAWKNRRRIVYGAILWSSALMSYILIATESNSLHETGVLALAGIFASTIGSYVFGAVWDDSNIRKTSVDTQMIYQDYQPPAANVTVVQPQQPAAGPTTVVSDKTTVTGGPVNVNQADPNNPPDGFAQ